MPSKGGLALRGADSFLRMLQLLCAALILGIFSWFLAYLTKHDQQIPTWMKAVEGISGGAVIYTGIATILTCFLGGITFFALLAILLDVCFLGAFVAIAILARGGKRTQGANSPLGNRKTRDAKLQTAAFAVAIIGALLFLLTAIHAILLNRHHKKEKRKGPSPSNNYTSGAGKTSFFKRNRKQKTNRDAEELGALGGGSALITEEKAHNNQHHSNDVRPSHDTGVTGTTVPVAETGYGGSVNKYSNEYASQQPNSRYNAYVPPESGTTQTHTHSHNPSHPYNGTAYGQGTTQPGMVVYDPEPYATVHGDGSPHQAKPGD